MVTIEEQLAQAERERDSFKRQLAMLQDAILLALVQRIEPRMSRHPVTVVQHAGSVIARIGEAIDCQFEDGDDLVAAVKELVRERDEALAKIAGLPAWQKGCEQALADLADAEEAIARLYTERDEARTELSTLRKDYDSVLEANVGLLDDAPWADVRRAYIRGAEAMREACAREASVCANHRGEELDAILSALPIPEEP